MDENIRKGGSLDGKLNKGIVKGTGKWTIRTGKIMHYE